MDYGVALFATKGWYVPEVGNAFSRARELCHGLGADPRLFSVTFGLWSFHLVHGEHRTARSYAEEMMRLAESAEDSAIAVEGCWALGCSRFFMGEPADAHACLQRGISLYDAQSHRNLAFLFGQDPCMSSLCYDAICLWMLGYPEQAEKRAGESLALARRLNHPFTLAWCFANLAKYYLTRREFGRAAETTEEGIPLCVEHGFALCEGALELTPQSVRIVQQKPW